MPIFDEDSSVTIESEDSLDTTEETTDEGQEDINNSEDGETESPATPETTAPEADVTDKGTKLADDPLSRANQLRANAEAKLNQAIDYINYLKNNQPQPQVEPKKEGEEELFLDATKIETTEDLQKFAASLKQVVEAKYQQLEKNFSSSIQERQIERTQESVAKGIESIQTSYPELREFNADGTKNPMYNPVLDKELSDQIVELDYDEARGIYKGSVNIAKLAERIVKSYRSGKSSGTESAKTKIIDKKIGSLRNTPAANPSNEENSESAESFIANAIKAKR